MYKEHEMCYASMSHLEELIVGHVGCQARERLPPTAAHTHQEGMALGMLNDTTDAVNVLNGKPAEDKRWSTAREGSSGGC